MFKGLSGFIAIIVIIMIFRAAVPQEAVGLAGEILIKVLSLIRDLLAQIDLPQ